ncbi:hypothetical protein LTR66_003330 [Elasticomyces elasticus]|nr:hypothetical protein LTR66_003330 [Elasticomyces elasticus]KAK5008989.1 hypothetical protein LTR28_003231 [Elasticomyces elasticus]
METALDLPPSMEAAHVDVFVRAHDLLFIQPAIEHLSSLQAKGAFDHRDALFNRRLYGLAPRLTPTPPEDPFERQDARASVDSPSSPVISPPALPPKDCSLEVIEQMLGWVDRHELILKEDIARTTSILDNALASVRTLHETTILHTAATKRTLHNLRDRHYQERLPAALEQQSQPPTTSAPGNNSQTARTSVPRTDIKRWKMEEGSALSCPHVPKQEKQLVGLGALEEHELYGKVVVKNDGDGVKRPRPGTQQGRPTPRAKDGALSAASSATEATGTISSRALNTPEQRSKESVVTQSPRLTITPSPPLQLSPIHLPDQESDVPSLEQSEDLNSPPARPQKRSSSSSLEPPIPSSPTETTSGNPTPSSPSSIPHTSASSKNKGTKRKIADTDTRFAKKHCSLASKIGA